MSYDANCPFCNPQKDVEQNIIFENETCFFLQHINQQEVLEGCGLIVPKKHHANPFELTKDEWNDTNELLQDAKKYLDDKYSPDGYTLGWNVGEVSNQSILHSHLHVIPRYNDEPLAGKGVRYWLKQPENKREKLKLK
ncbi:HIT family protein [Psychrobacillus sp. FJAT-21963]|uniref:HIT family protein n=1 Tax=Psychrobacillus sp. FJAT-21963 TaxID=1712028 RepID=UPI0006F86AF5|nr:HIT family protein [Psychrobacillus sp. FJAT-21963]KQL34400.1 cell-cycle regulation histidine triad HIT protein [Psychrobacillus sp. FJAT-21963]